MKREPEPGSLPLLPIQPIGLDVLREKYLKPGESNETELFHRVARALASVERAELREEWERKFEANLEAGAIGAGRIMSAAGTELEATLINCFVQPVGDCIQGTDDEGYPGIYEALREAAETMRRGGGVGYDFSRIRPRGAEVKATHSLASGPCSYMDVFDHSCSTVESAGARRGAQMGVLRIDHPDVLEFITAKRKPGRWNNFNVSVAVTDEFMRTVQAGGEWPLVHRAKPGAALIALGAHQRADGLWVYRTVSARELWETVMKSAYDFAEPGILFVDTINRENNLRYAEKITATNPCVTGDTWVMTSEGPQQAADLVGRPVAVLVDGKAFSSSSNGFFSTGRKSVVRVECREGQQLRLTPNHLVRRVVRSTRYVREVEWVPAGDLHEGDEILLHDHRDCDGWEGTGTEEQGYLLGLLIGDGHLKADKAVIAVWDHELKVAGADARTTSAAGIVDAAEAAARTLPHRSDFGGFQRPVAGGRGEVRLQSAPLRDLAFSFGMSPGNKSITPAMERCSSDFASGLLRGLFDADGSIQGSTQKGISVRLNQCDVALLETAQRMLLRMGIASTLYKNRRPELRRLMPDGRGGSKTYTTQANHELVIAGENLRTYAQRVGFSDTDKSARLEAALSSYKRGLNREKFAITVAALHEDGEDEVFDISVPGANAFDANGLYVHNCGEQPLPA
ncbi:MAG TPA: LAGLIDADG family homing endonuclease, partial [Ramlibacter sp.]|nr:LAGLIDADG family homing endonuclease [Ramlibacter sp.]